jgi:hypothetical protein
MRKIRRSISPSKLDDLAVDEGVQAFSVTKRDLKPLVVGNDH